MGSSPYSGNGILAKELEEELMKFTKKDEDYKLVATSNEQAGEIQRPTEVEIDVTECTQSSGNEVFEGEFQGTTESSSSFDGSCCGVEHTDFVDDSKGFCDDAASALKLDGFEEKFIPRRKLTTHWRSFIQPLVWRCKWIELQIKKLQSQAQQYDQDLEEYSIEKRTNLENTTPDIGMKSLTFGHTNARSDILKRKKRRIVEDTTDIPAYMSSHNIFSYHETKKPFSESAFMSNLPKSPATTPIVNADDGLCSNDNLLSVEPGNHENSLEYLLQKIYYLQSKVGKLKGKVDWVMTENAGKLSCTDVLNLPVLCKASTSTSGDTMLVGTYIASQLISEYNMGDIFVTDGAVMSHGDLPDANGRKAHAKFSNACKNVEDMVLIDNQRVKDELNTFDQMRIPSVESPLILNEGLGNAAKEETSNSKDMKTHPIQSPSMLKDQPGSSNPSISTQPNVPADDEPPTKICSIAKLMAPKSKKRRRRKGAGRWSRRPKD